MSRGDLLVFDVGGTSLRAARWSSRAEDLVDQRSRPAPSFLTRPEAAGVELVSALVEELAGAGAELFSDDSPAAVGVAFPGPVDPNGRVLRAPTLWSDRVDAPIPLAAHLARVWPDVPVHVANDVAAAGYRFARADEVLCIVTVSSGVGHKVFIDGRPVVGPYGRGGELGHWRIDGSSDAPLCDCGERGHLGALASGRAVAHHVRRRAAAGVPTPLVEHLDDTDALNRALVEAVHAGDDDALDLVRDLAVPLARALAGVHVIIGAERFVVVGGLARALGAPYVDALRAAAEHGCWADGIDWSRALEAGPNDDESGLRGMARVLTLETRNLERLAR